MIDAVIFDKDGTLIDFDAFWVAVSVKAIKTVLENFKATGVSLSEILSLYGVNDGKTDIDGVLCKGTYEQMGEIFHGVLSRHGYDFTLTDVTNAVITAFNQSSDAGEIKPTCEGLCEVLKVLKAKGIKLAVVTTDNMVITEKCLRGLGIYELFDKIYTDDGEMPTKPNPHCVYDFMKTFSLDKEKVVMVGDTTTDIEFAKNAGISVISVYSNQKNKRTLLPYAEKLISSLKELESVL